jgi:hypothetical protein
MTQPGDVWTPCPPGQLEQLAGRLRQRRRRRRWVHSSALATATIALAAAAVLWMLPRGESRYGGMTCSEVIGVAEDYRNNQLSSEVRAQVVRHLEKCANCREHYEAMDILIRAKDLLRQQRAVAQRGAETPRAVAEVPAQPTPKGMLRL